MIAKLPKQTPAGQYLIRFDTIWPGTLQDSGAVNNYAQIYASCAQIEVESEYTGQDLFPPPERLDHLRVPREISRAVFFASGTC
jgi:hypothetical protein